MKARVCSGFRSASRVVSESGREESATAIVAAVELLALSKAFAPETSATTAIKRAITLLSSPGRSPCLGPPRNRMWGFPPSGSSADVSCGRLLIVYLQMLTTIRVLGRGMASRRSSNLSQSRRARWLRRLSHLCQLRRT